MHVTDITIVQVNIFVDIYYSQSLINIRSKDDTADGSHKEQQDTLEKILKESGKL